MISGIGYRLQACTLKIWSSSLLKKMHNAVDCSLSLRSLTRNCKTTRMVLLSGRKSRRKHIMNFVCSQTTKQGQEKLAQVEKIFDLMPTLPHFCDLFSKEQQKHGNTSHLNLHQGS